MGAKVMLSPPGKSLNLPARGSHPARVGAFIRQFVLNSALAKLLPSLPLSQFMDMNTEDNNFSAGDPAFNAGENGPDAVEDMNTDENLAGTTHLNDSMPGDDEVEKLKEELQAQKEKYL